MLLAVFLLLFAVGVVLVKDWTSLFPATEETVSSQPPDSGAAAPARDAPATQAAPATDSGVPKAPVAEKKHRRTSQVSNPAVPASEPASSDNGVVVTNRRVLPPLRVEVVAGNRTSPVHPGSPSMRVDLDPPASTEDNHAAPAASEAGPVDPPLTTASDRVRMSDGAELEVQRAPQPEYPMLARQMKVQGSVILEAMIGKDGGIQGLQVLHGPSILADAARQAVRQWRFKPYMQDGQAVETQAHITVNFTISTN
jgi:TonB family protein